jgi:hypothetical protein
VAESSGDAVERRGGGAKRAVGACGFIVVAGKAGTTGKSLAAKSASGDRAGLGVTT